MSLDHSSPRNPAETLRTALVEFLASDVSERHDDEGDDMTRQRFDHSQCEHPKTKAGRAGCRKTMRAAALGETAAAKAATATKSAEKVETPAEGEHTTHPVETAPAAEPTEITRETWKEHKGEAANVYVKGVEEPFAAQGVTGWSIKFLQFTDAEGKRQQIPASTVERVTV